MIDEKIDGVEIDGVAKSMGSGSIDLPHTNKICKKYHQTNHSISSSNIPA